MSNLFICKIHNNILGKSLSVNSYDDGIQKIIEWAEEQLDRSLTDEEKEEVNSNGEFFDDSDHDNHFTFSIGVLE